MHSRNIDLFPSVIFGFVVVTIAIVIIVRHVRKRIEVVDLRSSALPYFDFAVKVLNLDSLIYFSEGVQVEENDLLARVLISNLPGNIRRCCHQILLCILLLRPQSKMACTIEATRFLVLF